MHWRLINQETVTLIYYEPLPDVNQIDKGMTTRRSHIVVHYYVSNLNNHDKCQKVA